MDSMPPLQVTVDAPGCACILDVRLALSRHGLTLALRLAEELRVFLVPTLWQVLDNTSYYERSPGSLAGEGDEPSGSTDELAAWEAARLELGLSGQRLYWAGDRMYDSSLPREIDPAVITRFLALAEQLERSAGGGDSRAAMPLLEGSRDAAALAVAMSRYRPLVLTRGASDGGLPPMCRYLQSCGIACREIGADEARHPRAYFVPMLVRCGALELVWAGLRLTAVHLVAPLAALMSFAAAPRAAEDGGPPAPPDCWRDASAYWYSLP